MSCDDCKKFFSHNCEAKSCSAWCLCSECVDQRRKNRTALFDYMMCVQMEEQFEDETEQESGS